jgi:hypothetical protein
VTPPDTTPADVSIRDLEARWGLSRNGLKARARALGVELRRVSSTLTVWPGEFLEVGDRLQEHLASGSPMGTFPGLAPSPAPGSDGTGGALTAPSPDGLAALVTAIRETAPTPPPDPLAVPEALARAADAGHWLSTAELAQLLRLGAATIARWGDGHQPRPGYRLERLQDRPSAPVWWRVARTGTAHSLPAVPAGRRVGFGSDVIEARFEVLPPGPALFPLPRC